MADAAGQKPKAAAPRNVRDEQIDELIDAVYALRSYIAPVVWIAWLSLAGAILAVGAAVITSASR